MAEVIRKRSRRVNYLSNKLLLREIHSCKTKYCFYEDKKYETQDLVVLEIVPVPRNPNIKLRKMVHSVYPTELGDLEVNKGITEELVEKARAIHALRLNELEADRLFYEEGKTNKEANEYINKQGLKPSDIPVEDIVIRFNTSEHIPMITDPKGKQVKLKTNFPPFQNFAFKKGKLVCVGKSHCDEKGMFNGINITAKEDYMNENIRISDQLGKIYMMLVEKYGKKFNWRGYSWNADMQAEALIRLIKVGLKFDEGKGDNPFAWYTSVVNHAFTGVLNKEKDYLKAKNKIMVNQGFSASFEEQARVETKRQMSKEGRDLDEFNKMYRNQKKKQAPRERSRDDLTI